MKTIIVPGNSLKNADRLEYYFEARLEIERMFSESNLVPRNWENYKSLWYHYFKHHYLKE